MTSFIRQRPAGWFTIVAVLLLLWGLAGCAALYAHVAFGPKLDPKASEWDHAYFAALPVWFTPVYAVAVLGGLFGSVALLLRSRHATPLYIASLLGVIVQFGYVFLGTDLLAHKGAAATVPFPLVIAAVAVLQIWLSRFAWRHGWIS